MKQPTKAELLKKTSGYLKIEFGYNCIIVLPHKEGIALLSAFENAETYNKDNYNEPKIVPYNGNIEITQISEKRYLNLKMSHLLKIPVSELEKADETSTDE